MEIKAVGDNKNYPAQEQLTNKNQDIKTRLRDKVIRMLLSDGEISSLDLKILKKMDVNKQEVLDALKDTDLNEEKQKFLANSYNIELEMEKLQEQAKRSPQNKPEFGLQEEAQLDPLDYDTLQEELEKAQQDYNSK